ncbi:MAG: hypothetical protein CMC86_06215 [Flavobacteriaceae bacterium]|nr:hypothetical protein [Flavobacteriaceae bacterium]|tara:strand:+ start:22576 stop:22965 length:390 start_codon:yes stop_codon:yes gene_type:complete
MKYIKQILVLFVSITVLNVWLIRFNNATIFRGGDAANMLEEFIVYGFDKPFLYLIGALKISAALGLLVGLFYKKLIVPCALIIGVLMVGAVVMHFRVSDEIHKFLPAGLMLLCCLSIIFISKKKANITS